MANELKLNDTYESWYDKDQPEPKLRSMVQTAVTFIRQKEADLGSFYGTIELRITAKHPED